jgi:hypothetical protein
LKYSLQRIGLPSDGNRQALYERYLGHLLEREEQEAAYKEARRKIDEKKRKSNLTDEEKDVEFPTWVQCFDCKKWRTLPHDILPEKIPSNWVCSMNQFDAAHNSCDKEEVRHDKAGTGADKVDVNTEEDKEEEEGGACDKGLNAEATDPLIWVQCDDCTKWRTLPPGTDLEALPDEWKCHMNTTDSEHNSCDKDEVEHEDFTAEEEEEEEEAVLEDDYKQEILAKFRKYKSELQEKQEQRAEKKRVQEEERLRKNLLKQEEDFEAWASSLTASQRAARKRSASKYDDAGNLPIHVYPCVLDEAKAVLLLRKDIHCGVDVNATDRSGLQAIFYGHVNHYEHYVDVLLQAGAEDDEYYTECELNDPDDHPSKRRRVKDEWGVDKFL